jgi:hypothetical protein
METKTDYNKQATDFLNATKTLFTVKYTKTGKYFDDDKQDRDIYEITLKRGNRVYTFKFGNSARNSGFYQIRQNYGGGKGRVYYKGQPIPQEQYKTVLKDLGYCNQDLIVKNTNYAEPTAYDVLACLTKYDPGTLEDFCGDFGYDVDSKKAEKIYEAVKDEWKNVCMLFTDEEIEKLQEIQ